MSWVGVKQGLEIVESKKRADEQMRLAEEQLNETRRNKRLDLLIAYTKTSKKTTDSAKAKSKLLGSLKAIGLPSDVAQYLASSGEGANILKIYESKMTGKQLSDKWIPSVIARVEKVLGDESSPQALAIATKAALLTTEDVKTEAGQEASLVEAIYAATNVEDFKEVDENLIALYQSGSTIDLDTDFQMPAIGGLLRGATGVDETRIKTISNEIIDKIAPTFGQVFTKNEDGTYTTNYGLLKGNVGAAEVQSIIDEAQTFAFDSIQGVDALNVDKAVNVAADMALKRYAELNAQSGNSSNTTLPQTPAGGLETGVNAVGGGDDDDIFNLPER